MRTVSFVDVRSHKRNLNSSAYYLLTLKIPLTLAMIFFTNGFEVCAINLFWSCSLFTISLSYFLISESFSEYLCSVASKIRTKYHSLNFTHSLSLQRIHQDTPIFYWHLVLLRWLLHWTATILWPFNLPSSLRKQNYNSRTFRSQKPFRRGVTYNVGWICSCRVKKVVLFNNTLHWITRPRACSLWVARTFVGIRPARIYNGTQKCACAAYATEISSHFFEKPLWWTRGNSIRE